MTRDELDKATYLLVIMTAAIALFMAIALVKSCTGITPVTTRQGQGN